MISMKPVRMLIDEGHVAGKNFIQVGLRGYYPGREGFEWMRKHGLRYHTMSEIDQRGWQSVMSDVLEEARDGAKYLYISFDIDVIEPGMAPGTGAPEPGGLTTREVLPLIRRLCAENEMVGFELVEFNPFVDPTYVTALTANRIVRECLTGIALRKKGITEKDYRSPLTKDDGH